MPLTLWRLTKEKYAAHALSGYGSQLHAGRWHERGVPVVYLAESPALALLETLVHVEEPQDLLAFDYVGVPVTLDAGEHLERLAAKDRPSDWRAWPWPVSTQMLGTRWIRQRHSVVLEVPSAVVPRQSNYLLNPHHPRFGELRVGTPEPFPVDPRLVG
jgi:RES domain-containing protein